VSVLSRLNLSRTDYLRQAEELADFAQSTEIQLRMKHIGHDVVNDIHEERVDTRKCFGCGKQGHLKAACPSKKTKGNQGGDVDYTLAVGHEKLDKVHWILDTGSSRHLVNDVNLLEDFESQCIAADGGALKVTKHDSVMLETTAMAKKTKVKLLDVQYAENLERNIISYGLLEKKGFRMEYRCPHCVIAATSGKGAAVLDVHRRNNVLVVHTTTQESGRSAGDVLMAALAETQEGVGPDVQVGTTLMQFHRRLGHLNYDTIVKIAKDPASGIALTDHKRDNSLTCAQGKQTKNAQSRKDTGANSPIDVIGGVICSDLKGPVTPKDRLGNRYMVNFIDYRSNHCRIFLAKTKDVATLKFKHFLAFFERQFNCRIHVLRMDGGGEYKPLDLFCEQTGIARQISKPRNQASNGKAERMHRTIMNMVRSMVFACGLPLSFWGDAAEYAAYILNRSPSKGNPGSKSPMQMLTKRIPDISDIVAFGSPCTVHRDTKNMSLGVRGKSAMIIGKSDEMKGYMVYLPKDRVVVVTQHVRNVETLTVTQNEQLRRAHLQDPEELKEEEANGDPQRAVEVAKTKGKCRAKIRWTREKHQTRSATRKAASPAPARM